jgi:hypothetical protein
MNIGPTILRNQIEDRMEILVPDVQRRRRASDLPVTAVPPSGARMGRTANRRRRSGRVAPSSGSRLRSALPANPLGLNDLQEDRASRGRLARALPSEAAWRATRFAREAWT